VIDVEELRNLIRREVALVLSTRGTTRIGLVTDYDPNNHAAKVAYQPDGTLSGWIPVGTAAAGDSYGIHFAPQVNDQVMVHFLEGVHDTGVIGMRLYSDQDPPLPVPAGELWMVQSSGSLLKFHNDGSVECASNADLTVTVGGDLTATVSGDMEADVSGTATIKAPTVNLGDTGGPAVARVGDTVQVGSQTGTIVTGSSKVRAA
jgi:phage baseplate assembly protein gpV